MRLYFRYDYYAIACSIIINNELTMYLYDYISLNPNK